MSSTGPAGSYAHLEMVREPDWAPRRRPGQGRTRRPPVPSDRAQHGREIGEAAGQLLREGMETRARAGVESKRYIVLEFESVNNDPRQVLEENFNAIGLAERKESMEEGERFALLAQFRDDAAVEAFRREAALYAEGSTARALLPPGRRRDFFDAVQEVRFTPREQRLGARLREEGYPSTDLFYMDLDLWHPGDDDAASDLLQEVRSLCQRHGGQLTESVRTSSLLLAKVRGPRALADALLDLDFIARLDLPPSLGEAYPRIFSEIDFPDPGVVPDERSPLACVIDSGVISGHPLLANWVLDEEDFDSGEGTAVDRNGHGTSVAGLVVYGDIAKCLADRSWQPIVTICSAKILRHQADPDNPVEGEAIFPEENRLEATIEQAIRHFHSARNCRVFNLSFGNRFEIYDGGRQFPLAEKLDELARDLDIVIVVSAGNMPIPPIPEGATTRQAFQEAVQAQLLEPSQRVINPATSALSLTVGAIARSDATGNP